MSLLKVHNKNDDSSTTNIPSKDFLDDLDVKPYRDESLLQILENGTSRSDTVQRSKSKLSEIWPIKKQAQRSVFNWFQLEENEFTETHERPCMACGILPGKELINDLNLLTSLYHIPRRLQSSKQIESKFSENSEPIGFNMPVISKLQASSKSYTTPSKIKTNAEQHGQQQSLPKYEMKQIQHMGQTQQIVRTKNMGETQQMGQTQQIGQTQQMDQTPQIGQTQQMGQKQLTSNSFLIDQTQQMAHTPQTEQMQKLQQQAQMQQITQQYDLYEIPTIPEIPQSQMQKLQQQTQMQQVAQQHDLYEIPRIPEIPQSQTQPIPYTHQIPGKTRRICPQHPYVLNFDSSKSKVSKIKAGKVPAKARMFEGKTANRKQTKTPKKCIICGHNVGDKGCKRQKKGSKSQTIPQTMSTGTECELVNVKADDYTKEPPKALLERLKNLKDSAATVAPRRPWVAQATKSVTCELSKPLNQDENFDQLYDFLLKVFTVGALNTFGKKENRENECDKPKKAESIHNSKIEIDLKNCSENKIQFLEKEIKECKSPSGKELRKMQSTDSSKCSFKYNTSFIIGKGNTRTS